MKLHIKLYLSLALVGEKSTLKKKKEYIIEYIKQFNFPVKCPRTLHSGHT